MNGRELAEVDRALRKTTETLARELAQPTARAPDWSDFEWRMARAVSSMHGVSALLARRLCWESPDSWLQFLADQHQHTEARHRRMQDVLATIGDLAASEGIAIVPLKGAALYALGLYEPGTRPMADLDLLVREQDAQQAGRILKAFGFQHRYTTQREQVFALHTDAPAAAFGENAQNYLKIELHTRISEPLPLRPVDISQILLERSPQPGLNEYPSAAALMGHVLLHAAGAITARSLRLLHLHDIASLAGRMTDADWDQLFARFSPIARGSWWASPPLEVTARYFPGIPESVLLDTAAGVPRRLRRATARYTLSDVSLSHLWIEAFPGIEWAQSLGEMLALAARRVLPNRNVRHIRRVTVDEPYLAGQEWARMSQTQRMLKWATSRQPRAPTLHVVRRALAQTQ
jgi:hypothetical protein